MSRRTESTISSRISIRRESSSTCLISPWTATKPRRSHARAYFTVGFSDPAAVPSSVYAAFNAYGGEEKEIMDFPDCGHAGSVFWAGEAELLRDLKNG